MLHSPSAQTAYNIHLTVEEHGQVLLQTQAHQQLQVVKQFIGGQVDLHHQLVMVLVLSLQVDNLMLREM